jgi:ring-1,2-phenylacetyl-CoA epoxidase subunit PaaA
VADPDGRAEVQAAVDWMFILTLEWFGLPDTRKRHGVQLEYGFKGKTNDELRQDWMSEVVPFMEEVGIRVPSHYDEESDSYLIDCPFPARFDPEKREWDLSVGPVSWDEVLERWKGRGEMNRVYVTTMQRGYQEARRAAVQGRRDEVRDHQNAGLEAPRR